MVLGMWTVAAAVELRRRSETDAADADVMAAVLEDVDDGRAVAVLGDDFLAFGTELEAVGVCPFGAAVAAHVPTDGLKAHFGVVGASSAAWEGSSVRWFERTMSGRS